jgi:hypothetical protein
MCCSVQYPAITKDVGGKASFSNSRLKGRCRPSGGAEDGSRRRSHTASQRRSDELEMWNNCQFCRQYSGSDSRKRKANRGAQNLHKCLGRGGIRTHGTVTRTRDFLVRLGSLRKSFSLASNSTEEHQTARNSLFKGDIALKHSDGQNCFSETA